MRLEELGRAGSQSTPASVRRELWRETQQQSVGSVEELSEPRGGSSVFTGLSSDTGPEEYLSPFTSRSPQSSFSSPQVSVDSPRISFSPLHIKDSIEETEEDGRSGLAVTIKSQSLTVPGYCTPPTLLHPGCEHLDTGQPGLHHQRSARGRASAPGLRSPVPGSQPRWPSPSLSLHPGPGLSPRARSVSPISLGSRCASCPRSPVPGAHFGHLEQFFRQRLGSAGEERASDVYRRWMSDTDISSDCLDPGGAGANISHSQDIQDTDNVFYNPARSDQNKG